jgi:hypothetical protein
VRADLSKLRGVLFHKVVEDLHLHLYNKGEYRCLQWVPVHVHVQAHCADNVAYLVAYILVLSIRVSRGAASSFQNL